MNKIAFLFTTTLLSVASHAAGNQDKVTQLQSFQRAELSKYVKRSDNIGKDAAKLDESISNTEKFCRAPARINGKDCTTMIDKVLSEMKAFKDKNAVLDQALINSATGGAAAAKGGETKAPPKTPWQKGHSVAGPTNTANTVGAPQMQGKVSPTMGRKKPAPATTEKQAK